MERRNLASITNSDAVALELVDEVVGHRLGEAVATVEESNERAATGEPDSCLAGGVAAADDRNAVPGAELAFRRAGGIEHRRALELGQVVDREPPILGARREQHRSRGDLPVLLEPDEVPTVSRFERERAVGRGGSCIELARLGDGAAGELRSADSRREAEIVLDSAGRPGLAAERRALDHQRVKPFRGAVDRSREASRTGADAQQIDLLASREPEPDPDRSAPLAGRRPV